jgi:hypothetical protein
MNLRGIVLAVLVVSVLPWAGCTQQSTTVPVRSLERSGRVSFVCLNNPTSAEPGVQLDTCFPPATPFASNDYVSGPHVLGLVTQTSRGEVAVIDVTAQTVLDADITVPGFNFLPVGALPTDIASTPGGNATFVASGDPVRPGIFAIPSARLPGQAQAQKPMLASWPACSLDAVPTALTIVPDHTGNHPGLCNASVTPTAPTPGFDLSNETQVYGRLKILATLAESGTVVVIDAQELLARKPGTFDPCPIDGAPIKLQAVEPGASDNDAGPSGQAADAATPEASVDGAATADAGAPVSDATAPVADAGTDVDAGAVDQPSCSVRVAASPTPSLISHPVDTALADDGRLFISDDQASVIHVLDTTDPCNITEKAPLLPFSAADPSRAVVSTSIAVSPILTDMKRYVYAVDSLGGGTVMVFDVSPDSTTRRPLLRPDIKTNPFEPPDRIAFSSAVQGLIFVTRELPRFTTPGGQLPRAIKCDPAVSDPNNPAYIYRPDNFQTDGAGPHTLRGTFAFAILASGRISVVDVDDYDAACRRPAVSDDMSLGCSGQLMGNVSSTTPLFSASGENSCNIVERHRIRSNVFFANATNAGQNAPAMQIPPALFDKTGTLLSTDTSRPEAAGRPRLLGPSLANKSVDTRSLLATITSGSGIPDDAIDLDLNSDPSKSLRNWVTFDLREPRSHFTQSWLVTFEGILPPFVGRRGRFQCLTDKPATECENGPNASSFVLYDSSIGFCDSGAQGVAIAQAQGMSPPSGDVVQVLEPLPDPADPYWATVANVCNPNACQLTYGTPDDPLPARDFIVDTSYEDRLVLQPDALGQRAAAPLACCFPYPLAYTVRAGKQWLVTGGTTNYLHHIIPDPTAADPSTARCIVSCDTNLALRNSRAFELTPGSPIPTYDPPGPGVFQNPELRFVLWAPAKPETCTPPNVCVLRDSYFTFVETGGFVPLEVGLSTLPVIVQSVQFVRSLDELALPDSVSQGLMLFDVGALSSNGVRVFN